jgi:hypothetical protein
MNVIVRVGVIALAVLAWGCDGPASGGDAEAPRQSAERSHARELTLLDYLDLKTDALTSDKVDWKKAMETARGRLVEDTDGAKEYILFMPPVQWFNAEHDVLIHAWRRKDDREIVKGPPNRGYLVVVNASTGAVTAAGAYQR